MHDDITDMHFCFMPRHPAWNSIRHVQLPTDDIRPVTTPGDGGSLLSGGGTFTQPVDKRMRLTGIMEGRHDPPSCHPGTGIRAERPLRSIGPCLPGDFRNVDTDAIFPHDRPRAWCVSWPDAGRMARIATARAVTPALRARIRNRAQISRRPRNRDSLHFA